MIYLMRPPGVPSDTWATYRHNWTHFAADQAHAVIELPFGSESEEWIEEQACRSPTTLHVSLLGNFIPYCRFWDELAFLMKMGKRAIAEEITDLVYRRNVMEPDLDAKGTPGRAIRIYRGKAPTSRRWWDRKYNYQYLMPLYFDGDPGAPGYKCALGRIMPVFWRGWDFPSGRTISPDGEYNKTKAAVRYDWHVRDWQRWRNGDNAIFFG
jgi:hypothetical protein